MTDKIRKQRLYDVEEHRPKILEALEKLEKTEKPGQISGKVTKSEMMLTVKEEIEKLYSQGYTAKQIANAVSNNNAFGILPKTITEMFNAKGHTPKKSRGKILTTPLDTTPPIHDLKRSTISQPSKTTTGNPAPSPMRKGLVETGCSYNPVVTLGDKKGSK